MTGESPLARMVYDRNNDSYYRSLFDHLAESLEADSDKIEMLTLLPRFITMTSGTCMTQQAGYHLRTASVRLLVTKS